MNRKHIVVGLGEIGSAIKTLLTREHGEPQVAGYDASDEEDETLGNTTEFLHICFPYSDDFVDEVKKYQKKYEPEITVIHSTVPVGTSDKVGAVHSPVRGVHPNLIEGIKTFVKYFGGPEEKAKRAAQEFENITVVNTVADQPDSEYASGACHTEAAKLWSTTYYGVCILFNKIVHRYCEENDLNDDLVYGHWNITYNAGYANLGKAHVIRPILEYMEGPIGGHCIEDNAKLLDHETINEIFERENH